MKNRTLKKWVVPTIYLSAIFVSVSMMVLGIIFVNNAFDEKEKFSYSINGIDNDVFIPVNSEVENETKFIIKPYSSLDVKVGRGFYNYQDEPGIQENSIIFYENTYIQNTGIDYTSENVFDVLSVLPGVVSEVTSSDDLGNIIKIKHDNDIVTTYAGVSEVAVKEGDNVSEGQVIAKSGNSNINSNFLTSLHFECYYKGNVVNPEKFYTYEFLENE